MTDKEQLIAILPDAYLLIMRNESNECGEFRYVVKNKHDIISVSFMSEEKAWEWALMITHMKLLRKLSN